MLRFTGPVPLEVPLWIVGGRNVRVIGLHMVLKTQPGCEPGRVRQNDGAMNIHPVLPGGMAVRFEQSGVTFFEGGLVDVTGHDADCFVIRNSKGITAALARAQRDVVIQNTSCHGVEGIAAGVHGDLVQAQGGDVLRSLILENVSHRTSHEGLVLEGQGGFRGAVQLTLRRSTIPGTRATSTTTLGTTNSGLPLPRKRITGRSRIYGSMTSERVGTTSS